MKWFKHSASANQDAKLKRVRMKYGMEGYGLYWYCVELIAVNVEQGNLTFELEHDAEIISFDTSIHYERVQEMMAYMVSLGLFEEKGGKIICSKLAKRADEYTAKYLKTNLKLIKSLETPDTIGSKSKETPDTIGTLSGDYQETIQTESSPKERKRKEKKREEKIQEDYEPSKASLTTDAFDFWVQTMGKSGNAKLTTKRRRAISNRLKDGYSLDDIKRAIIGCSRSPFHMGENDRQTQFNDIELICRSGEKLEYFRDSVSVMTARSQFSSTTKQNVSNLEDWRPV